MSDESQNHPTEDTLTMFIHGQLAPSDAESVAEHIDSCQECGSTVENVGDDTFIDIVRRSVDVPSDDSPHSDSATAPTRLVALSEADTPAGELLETVTPSGLSASEVADEVKSDEIPEELTGHDRYEIIEQIGRGGMGTVYRARHRVMNRDVAIKVLSPQLIGDEESVLRFRREVQAAAKVDHPHIVRSYDADQVGDRHFLVMELLDGEDLGRLLKVHGRLPVGISCEVIRQAALGIHHAHQQGLIHRDIKPGNMVILRPKPGSGEGGGPVAKLLDLGLARFAVELPGTEDSDVTEEGTVAGTIDYMAPEQARDTHSVDLRVDVYSLAASLYRTLTGQPPYQTANGVTARMRLLRLAMDPLIPIRKFRPDCPARLASLIERALSRNPDERPATAEELARGLQPYADGSGFPGLFVDSDSASESGLSAVMAAPAVKAARDGRRFGLRTAVMLLVPAVIVIAGMIYRIRAGQAVLEVEVADPQVIATLGSDALTVEDRATGRRWKISTDGGESRLPPGEYALVGGEQLRIVDEESGVVIRGSEFELLAGTTRRFRISVVTPESGTTAAGESDVPSVQAAPAVAGASGGLLLQRDLSRIETPVQIDGQQSVTLEAFVTKTAVRPRWQNLFSNFAEKDDTFFGFHAGVDESTDRWMISVWDKGISRQVNSSVSSVKSEEVHVAVVFRIGSHLRMFIDGRQEVFIPVGEDVGLTSSRLWIGNGVPRSGQYSLVGAVRQVRISSGLLYDENFDPPTSLEKRDDTIALYLLDQQSGGEIIADSSGNGREAVAWESEWLPPSSEQP